jgi:hypothetical protein
MSIQYMGQLVINQHCFKLSIDSSVGSSLFC